MAECRNKLCGYVAAKKTEAPGNLPDASVVDSISMYSPRALRHRRRLTRWRWLIAERQLVAVEIHDRLAALGELAE